MTPLAVCHLQPFQAPDTPPHPVVVHPLSPQQAGALSPGPGPRHPHWHQGHSTLPGPPALCPAPPAVPLHCTAPAPAGSGLLLQLAYCLLENHWLAGESGGRLLILIPPSRTSSLDHSLWLLCGATGYFGGIPLGAGETAGKGSAGHVLALARDSCSLPTRQLLATRTHQPPLLTRPLKVCKAQEGRIRSCSGRGLGAPCRAQGPDLLLGSVPPIPDPFEG